MSDRLASVEELGLKPEKVESLLKRVQRDVDEGLLPGVQLALARKGKLAVLESYGIATNDSLICIFSATKAIVSAAAWLLFQEGKLAEDEVVADIIPEFGSQGKHHITVGQLFTHTAGFPHAPFSPLQWNSKKETLDRFAEWRLNWAPGTRFEYHASSSMWVVAEIIERRSGHSYTDFIRRRMLDPLGLGSIFVGLPQSENHRALAVELRGKAQSPEDQARLGIPAEITEKALLAYNRPDVRAVGVPGGGGFANACDLALFYQAMLHGGLDGIEFWNEQTRISVREIRSGDLTDTMSKKAANRGLGIIISGDESRTYRGFGKMNSPQAFGHNGAGGQLAWADPATGISLAYLTSGHDRDFVHQIRRGAAISSLASECAL